MNTFNYSILNKENRFKTHIESNMSRTPKEPSLVTQTVKNLPAMWVTRFNPWVRKIPWRREWLLIQVFLPGEVHGQRFLAGYSPWGCKESDTTEVRYMNGKRKKRSDYKRLSLSWWSAWTRFWDSRTRQWHNQVCILKRSHWLRCGKWILVEAKGRERREMIEQCEGAVVIPARADGGQNESHSNFDQKEQGC